MENFSGLEEVEVDFTELLDNESSSICAAKHLASSNASSSSLEDMYALRSYLFCFYFLILVLGGSLNGTVIWLVGKYSKLRTPDLAITLQIIGVNLALLFFLVFLSLINIAAGKWILGSYVCVIQGFLHVLLTNVRQFLLVAMALERFLLVFIPYEYPKYQVRAAFLFSCVCWSAAVVVNLPFLPGILDCYSFATFNYNCVLQGSCSNTCQHAKYIKYAMVLLPSFVLPVIMYSAMYIKALCHLLPLQCPYHRWIHFDSDISRL